MIPSLTKGRQIIDEPRPKDNSTDGVVPRPNDPSSALQPPDRSSDKGDIFKDLENEALGEGLEDEAAEGNAPPKEDEFVRRMLKFASWGISSAETYHTHVRRNWQRTQRAYRNRHFEGSKYESKSYESRSKHFRPKTLAAIRRSMANTSASLFSTVNAVAISAGNESDKGARASADLYQEVINYRLDRTSGRNAIPWFLTAMGAQQTATMTGIVCSVQNWKLENRKVGEQQRIWIDEATGEQHEVWEVDDNGNDVGPVVDPIYERFIDRPDCTLVQPENVIIHTGADWTNPAQSSAFLFLQFPMTIEEIRGREKDEDNPFYHLPDALLRSGARVDNSNSQSVRSAREAGLDRFEQAAKNSGEFQTVWVTLNFMRVDGEDYTWYSIGAQHVLTYPKPVREVYPWNDGERPVVIGYGAIDAHKIFPFAPAESWQSMQMEINDLANLTLDSVKLSIAPVAKVRRGAQVDLGKLGRRAPGTNILMNDPGDVEFDKPPGVDAGAYQEIERLNNDFDTLAGQFDQGSVATNRQLNETVGGMRLISGAANAIQEFDQRVFFETWAEPVIAQILKLEQYYEDDQTVLGLCGERAGLWKKHGINVIDNQLMSNQVTARVDLGNGAGDPQQRISKFSMAAGVVAPLIKGDPRFGPDGEYEINVESIFEEVFGSAGYRDGGMRFLTKKPKPSGPNPAQDVEIENKRADTLQKQSVANLNMVKANSTGVETRLRVHELMTGMLNDYLDRHERVAQGAREDARSAQERSNSLADKRMEQERADQEGRTSRSERALDREHEINREKLRYAGRGQRTE